MACCGGEENGHLDQTGLGHFGVTERWWDGRAFHCLANNIKSPKYPNSWYEARGYVAGITLRLFCLFLCMFFFPFLPLSCYQPLRVCRYVCPVGVAPHPFLAAASASDAFWVTGYWLFSCILPVHPRRACHLRRSLVFPDLLRLITCVQSPATPPLTSLPTLAVRPGLPRNVEFWERCRIGGDRVPLTSRLHCSSEHCPQRQASSHMKANKATRSRDDAAQYRQCERFSDTKTRHTGLRA